MRRRAEQDKAFERVKQNLFEAGVSALKAALGARVAAPSNAPVSPQSTPLPKAAMDRVYESALKSSLQVIR